MKTNKPLEPDAPAPIHSKDGLALRICHIDFSLEGNITNPQFRYTPQTNSVTDHGKQSHTLPEMTAMLEAGRQLRDLVQAAEKNFLKPLPRSANAPAHGQPRQKASESVESET